MECILHVGLHHTATTSFQNFLFRNSNLLKENGILYPKSMVYGNSQQHNLLPASLIKDHHALENKRSNDPLFYIKALNDELVMNKQEICIISSEVYSELLQRDKEGLLKILAYLAAFRF